MKMSVFGSHFGQNENASNNSKKIIMNFECNLFIGVFALKNTFVIKNNSSSN